MYALIFWVLLMPECCSLDRLLSNDCKHCVCQCVFHRRTNQSWTRPVPPLSDVYTKPGADNLRAEEHSCYPEPTEIKLVSHRNHQGSEPYSPLVPSASQLDLSASLGELTFPEKSHACERFKTDGLWRSVPEPHYLHLSSVHLVATCLA